MFGQLAWFVPGVPGVVLVPPLVDGVDNVAGVGVADGSGLAALTIAAPPTVRRPTARRREAATRFTPKACAPVWLRRWRARRPWVRCHPWSGSFHCCFGGVNWRR